MPVSDNVFECHLMLSLSTSKEDYHVSTYPHFHKHEAPGGVLRYISDGDVRSPFLGLKFAI